MSKYDNATNPELVSEIERLKQEKHYWFEQAEDRGNSHFNYQERIEKELAEKNNQIEQLTHFKQTLLGCWATDRPDKLSEHARKWLFWEIK